MNYRTIVRRMDNDNEQILCFHLFAILLILFFFNLLSPTKQKKFH